MARILRHVVTKTSCVTSSASPASPTTEYACQYTGRTCRSYSSANARRSPDCASKSRSTSSATSVTGLIPLPCRFRAHRLTLGATDLGINSDGDEGAGVRRRTRILLAATVAALALAVAIPIIADEERVDPYLNFTTAHLNVLPTEPAAVSSDAKFSRTIAKFTDLESVDPALDACAGPVAVHLGDDHPKLVAEHDYCGGSDWMPKLGPNDIVQLTGPGIEAGLYSAV